MGNNLIEPNKEYIQKQSYNNTSQQLGRHIYINSDGEYDHDISDVILKKGDYANTYIAIHTTGIPNGVVLNLVDENNKQLYSPINSNGDWITTICSITVGESNIIPLPAQFNNQLSSHIPFSTGEYNWKLIFTGDDYYDNKELPLTIKIDDFKVWDIQTPEIYPNDSVKVKIKTYANTYYTSYMFDNSLLTTNATYNAATGIITYPNSDINTSLGKHTQIINQSNNCFIDYTVKNPFYFVKKVVSNTLDEDTNIFLSDPNDYYKIGCALHESCDPIEYPINSIQIEIDGEIINGDVNLLPTSITQNISSLPPGMHTCVCTVTLTDGRQYICEETFEVTIENCELLLTSDTDYIDVAIGSNFTLTAYYSCNNMPIKNATIGFYSQSGMLKSITTTDNNGQAFFVSNKPDFYIAKVINRNNIILESNICEIYGIRYVSSIEIDENGDLIIETYTGEYNDIELVNDVKISEDGELLYIDIKKHDNEKDVVVDVYYDKDEHLIYIVKRSDIRDYILSVEINEEGVIIVSTTTAKYDTIELVNDIKYVDDDGKLFIYSDINEDEDNILTSLKDNGEGALIFERISDI